MSSTPFWVAARIFLVPMLLLGVLLYAQTGPGQAAVEKVMASEALPELAAIQTALAGAGGAVASSMPRFQVPVANAKFTSGRTLMNSVFPSGRQLSGGGFITP